MLNNNNNNSLTWFMASSKSVEMNSIPFTNDTEFIKQNLKLIFCRKYILFVLKKSV